MVLVGFIHLTATVSFLLYVLYYLQGSRAQPTPKEWDLLSTSLDRASTELIWNSSAWDMSLFFSITNVFNHLLYQYRLMNIYIEFWVTPSITLFILLLKLSQL